MPAPAAQSRFRVQGMDCASCAQKIDTAVRRVEGVEDVSVSVTAGTMTVTHAGAATLADAIVRQVTRLGFRASALGEASGGPDRACGGCCGHGDAAAGGDRPHAVQAEAAIMAMTMGTTMGTMVAWPRGHGGSSAGRS